MLGEIKVLCMVRKSIEHISKKGIAINIRYEGENWRPIEDIIMSNTSRRGST